MRIALDAMGGDHAPAEVIRGGLDAALELENLYLYLIGPQDVLEAQMAGQDYPHNRVEIIHAADTIAADDAPVMAVRRKKDSSMMRAITMMKEGRTDAVVSAGNTGALMAGSLLIAGRLEGIERPALTIVAPTFNGDNVVIMDVGANMDAKAEHLARFALMGRLYAREVLEKPAPRVALLNVGTEENKGNDQVRKAYGLIKDSLDGFSGNVEARDVLNGAADVVVCDGFTGNILLKTVEGMVTGIFGALKETFSTSLKTKLAAAALIPELKKMKTQLDYAEYGGAPLLGIDGITVKCHGSSKARAVRSGIVQAYRFARQDVNGQIKSELAVLSPEY
ncbi:MAG: phosphate acyltransferase PlsX [Bacillota bacterium]|nr:phosphate acyltransferase PlsX [Bacillota bacterium]MDW7684456.1 phosphate acyltransferase PlsX [Bacillota bacterium]